MNGYGNVLERLREQVRDQARHVEEVTAPARELAAFITALQEDLLQR